jgi:hypothetical protein
MPQTTPDDHGDDPSAAPPNGTPQTPGHPAKKAHPPRLDQHGDAGGDTPTDPADVARHGKNPEAPTPDEGA